jgi:hypothetical protein
MIFRKLKQVFDQLPALDVNGKSYTPYFDFGTEYDLKKRLTAYRQSTTTRIYPLIWLVTPVEEATEMEVKFILATINKRTDMGNWDRLTYTFEATLEPLLNNLIKSLKQSRAFKPIELDRNYRGTKYFNYHIEPEIWDAIEYDINLMYNDDCPVKTKMNF